MKKIRNKKLLGLAMVAFLLFSCMDSGKKSTDNNSLLLFLLGNPGNPFAGSQSKCLKAYTYANSCVAGGLQQFNSGIGCSTANLKSEVSYDALLNCLNKKINDPVQPCSLPQFKYAFAQQAIAGALKDCNGKTYEFTPSGATEAQKFDLSGILSY